MSNKQPIETQVAVNGQKIDDHERRLKNIESNSEMQRETLYVVKEQQVMLREKFESMSEKDEKIFKALDGINENLQALHDDNHDLKNNVGNLDDRVGGLEQQNKDEDKEAKGWKKEYVTKLIFPIVSGLVLASLILFFGLK